MKGINLEKERIGTVRINKYGSLMEIIEYRNAHNILVRFDNGYTTEAYYKEFDSGSIKSPYCKSVCSVGFICDGSYPATINNKTTQQYDSWTSMLKRCYSIKYQNRQPTYAGCTVACEWYNFQEFAKWYDDNYYEVNGEKMNLDKDILYKGNKVYSPETCVFVPHNINKCFTKNNSKRGDLPIGVTFKKQINKYVAQAGIHIGCYNSPEDAFNAYKQYKEKLIKQIAEEHRGKIPNILFDTMMNYAVDFND